MTPARPAPAWLRVTSGGLALAVLAAPRASRTEIAGVAGDRLRIRLAAPPVEGAANDELVRFLAATLGVSRARVRVTAGAAGRRKTVEIAGLGPDAAAALAGAQRAARPLPAPPSPPP